MFRFLRLSLKTGMKETVERGGNGNEIIVGKRVIKKRER